MAKWVTTMVKWVKILKVKMVKLVSKGIIGFRLDKIRININQELPRSSPNTWYTPHCHFNPIVTIFIPIYLFVQYLPIWPVFTHLTSIYPFDHFYRFDHLSNTWKHKKYVQRGEHKCIWGFLKCIWGFFKLHMGLTHIASEAIWVSPCAFKAAANAFEATFNAAKVSKAAAKKILSLPLKQLRLSHKYRRLRLPQQQVRLPQKQK